MATVEQRLQTAATKAEQATSLIHDWLHGPEESFVETESGNVPTVSELNRQIAQDVDERFPPLERMSSSAYTEVNPLLAYEVDVSSPIVIDIALESPETTITITNSNPNADRANQTVLLLRQVDGANIVNWPESIRWANGQEPVLSFQSGKMDIVTLMSLGNGEVIGFSSGSWF